MDLSDRTTTTELEQSARKRHTAQRQRSRLGNHDRRDEQAVVGYHGARRVEAGLDEMRSVAASDANRGTRTIGVRASRNTTVVKGERTGRRVEDQLEIGIWCDGWKVASEPFERW